MHLTGNQEVSSSGDLFLTVLSNSFTVKAGVRPVGKIVRKGSLWPFLTIFFQKFYYQSRLWQPQYCSNSRNLTKKEYENIINFYHDFEFLKSDHICGV